jgi:beta-xylosidase
MTKQFAFPLSGSALAVFLLAGAAGWLRAAEAPPVPAPGSNPIIRDVFTADPAPVVIGDTVYLYVGHDNAADGEMFTMPDWLCYSSQDMKHWTPHGAVLSPTNFSWGLPDSAWAAQVVPKDGKFYYFVTVRGDRTAPGNNIGVAVADAPTGPFKDAIGKPLIRDSMTPKSRRPWEDIDPTIWIEPDGTPWLCWGNGDCYLVKLKPNLVELDGEIQKVDVPNYVEGPWLYRRGKLYYLVYAAMFPGNGSEQIGYATAEKITGPWTPRGKLTGPARNSFTIHPGIIEFKGRWYFFYHFAGLTLHGQKGALGRRAVCIEYLDYNPDGTIKPITQTEAGVSVPPEKKEVGGPSGPATN